MKRRAKAANYARADRGQKAAARKKQGLPARTLRAEESDAAARLAGLLARTLDEVETARRAALAAVGAGDPRSALRALLAQELILSNARIMEAQGRAERDLARKEGARAANEARQRKGKQTERDERIREEWEKAAKAPTDRARCDVVKSRLARSDIFVGRDTILRAVGRRLG